MKVISKQKSSKYCFICGVENPIGLKAQFYNMEDGSVMTLFKYLPEHQSFPQRVHGGLITTMLDELAMRAYWTIGEEIFGVTTSMETKFRKPVPYGVELIGKGEVISDTSRFFKSRTIITDKNNIIYSEAITNYIKMPISKIANDINFHEEMGHFSAEYLTEI